MRKREKQLSQKKKHCDVCLVLRVTSILLLPWGEVAPGKHFPGPDFPLLRMGKVNLVDKLYIF